RTLLQQRLPLRLQRAGGADANTLPAKDAGCIHHTMIHERADGCMEAAPVKVEGEGELRIVRADLYTAPAVNALVIVSQIEGVVVIDRRLAPRAFGEAVHVD